MLGLGLGLRTRLVEFLATALVLVHVTGRAFPARGTGARVGVGLLAVVLALPPVDAGVTGTVVDVLVAQLT